MTDPLSAAIELEIPFHDVDSLKIVWHGHYYKYFEIARTALLRRIGYDCEEMLESGYYWPVIESRCRYVRPLTYGSRIRVTATLVEHEYRLKIAYEICDALSDARTTSGSTVQVAVDARTNEMAIGSPRALLDRIEAARER